MVSRRLFSLGSKRPTPTAAAGASTTTPPPAQSGTTPLANEATTTVKSIKIDSFGHIIRPNLAFAKNESPSSTLQLSGGGRSAKDGRDENELLYGYCSVHPGVEVSITDAERAAKLCCRELVKRGLEVPLLLSTRSLDISRERTNALIADYVLDSELKDIHLVEALPIATFLKWILARLINEKAERGFLDWTHYSQWKDAEKAASYPSDSFRTFLIGLDSARVNLLSNLLDLFAQVGAHSNKNGLSLRKVSSLFSLLVFGCHDDLSFDETYATWVRLTDALEHILIAFIRNQQLQGRIPSHLEPFVQNYPLQINTGKVAVGERVEELTRIRRTTRFRSRNLISSAGAWEVPGSSFWPRLLPSETASSRSISTLATALPSYSSHYRHLLNIRTNGLDEDDDGDAQRYKSVVDKDWSRFGSQGFAESDPARLTFDLTEGERRSMKNKRMTMQWGTFAESGFGGRESYLPVDLTFDKLSDRVGSWPAASADLASRLRETERLLPEFPYDTTAKETGSFTVESSFIEAFLDVFVSGGWSRDDLKDSFVIIQFKARPVAEREQSERDIRKGDIRTEDVWVVIEEIVPKEYRDHLLDGKLGKSSSNKRMSFMRRNLSSAKSASPSSRLGQSPSPSPSPTPSPHRNGSYTINALPAVAEATTSERSDLEYSQSVRSTNAPSTSSTNAAQLGHSPPISTRNIAMEPMSFSQRLKASVSGDKSPKGFKFITRLTMKRSPKSPPTFSSPMDLRSSIVPVPIPVPASPTPLQRNASVSSSNWINVMTQESPEIGRPVMVESPSLDSIPPLPPPKSPLDDRSHQPSITVSTPASPTMQSKESRVADEERFADDAASDKSYEVRLSTYGIEEVGQSLKDIAVR